MAVAAAFPGSSLDPVFHLRLSPLSLAHTFPWQPLIETALTYICPEMPLPILVRKCSMLLKVPLELRTSERKAFSSFSNLPPSWAAE